MRAETGNMRFGDDWTGVFIRGDNAFGYSMSLERILRNSEEGKKFNSLDLAVAKGLLDILTNSNENMKKERPQSLKDFSECILTNNPKGE